MLHQNPYEKVISIAKRDKLQIADLRCVVLLAQRNNAVYVLSLQYYTCTIDCQV